MQILINLIAFLFGIAIGYLYGYYVRSRRAIKRLNESIDRTRREQEQLRVQYAEMRAQYSIISNKLTEIKEQRMRTPAIRPRRINRL